MGKAAQQFPVGGTTMHLASTVQSKKTEWLKLWVILCVFKLAVLKNIRPDLATCTVYHRLSSCEHCWKHCANASYLGLA